MIAYNVWLYVYTFRRILLFSYVVECWFCLVFIGFMPFMVLWSHFCLCRILPLYMVKCIGELLYYIFFVYQWISIILTIYNTYISIYCLNCFKSIYNLIPCLLLSRPMIVSRIPDKILVSSQEFLSDVLPRIFCPLSKMSRNNKTWLFYTSHKNVKVSFNQQ